MIAKLTALIVALFGPLGDFDHFCSLLGLIYLLDLLAFLPFFSAFFGQGARLEPPSKPAREPHLKGPLQLAWLLASLALIDGGRLPKLAASVFFYWLARRYYINSRWSSIRRGGGAPGFMTHWGALYMLMLQVASFLDGSGWLPGRVLTMARFDLAIIMICAGVYKYMIGYLKNDGMEYGRVNPMWSYFWRFFRLRNPQGLHETVFNILGSLVEIVAGVMMLHPSTEIIGSFSISVSFLVVGLLIRLGRLAWLMQLLPFIYFPRFFPSLVAGVPFTLPVPGFVLAVLGALVTAYIWILPVVKVTQYVNLFANRTWPEPVQGWLTRYANTVPIIIWRVFTPDVTNFYIRIFAIDASPSSGTAREIPILTEETYGLATWHRPLLKLRFWHVTESIAITSVFTTLKYFPSNRALFDQKLLTYARSLVKPGGPTRLRFEYVSIQKMPADNVVPVRSGAVYGDHDGTSPRRAGDHNLCFAFIHVGNFYANLDKGKVYEEKLEPGFDFSAPSVFSPVRESAAPGSYVKKD